MDGLLVIPISHEIDQRGWAKTLAAKKVVDRSQVRQITLYRCQRRCCIQNLSIGNFVITFDLLVNKVGVSINLQKRAGSFHQFVPGLIEHVQFNWRCRYWQRHAGGFFFYVLRLHSGCVEYGKCEAECKHSSPSIIAGGGESFWKARRHSWQHRIHLSCPSLLSSSIFIDWLRKMNVGSERKDIEKKQVKNRGCMRRRRRGRDKDSGNYC